MFLLLLKHILQFILNVSDLLKHKIDNCTIVKVKKNIKIG